MTVPIVAGFVNSTDFSFSQLPGINIDSTFVENMNSLKINLIKNEIELALKEEGIEGVQIEIESEGKGADLVVKTIYVYLSDSQNEADVDDEKVKNKVIEAYNIEKERIVVYERKIN